MVIGIIIAWLLNTRCQSVSFLWRALVEVSIQTMDRCSYRFYATRGVYFSLSGGGS